MGVKTYNYMYQSTDWSIKYSIIYASCFNSHANQISYTSCFNLSDLYDKSNIKKKIPSFLIPKPTEFKRFEVRADKTYDFINRLYWSTNSTHSAILTAIKCKGDTDTNASIIGELMNFTYNDITQADIDYVESKLDPYLLSILKEFNEKF